MPELDQTNIKDGALQVVTLASASWGNLGRVIIFIIVSAVIACIGWMVYTGNFKVITETINHEASKPKINDDALDEVARTLFKRAKADAVVFAYMAWGTSGNRVIKRIYLKDGRYKELDDLQEPIFSSNKAAVNLILSLAQGDVPCSALAGASNMLQLFYLDEGMTYRCAVSIPPEPSQFTGYIAVAWKDKASAESVQDLDGLLKTMAEKATKRP
jgi:hypothetical protein